MQCVAIDIFGQLPISENGNEYIIVLGEYFSKWVEAWAVSNHTAKKPLQIDLCVNSSQNRDVRNRSIRIKVANSSHICLRFYVKSLE